MLLAMSRAVCTILERMILATCPGEARERDWSGVGIPELEAAESYANCGASVAQSAILLPMAHLGAAFCPTDVIVSGLGTRLKDAYAEPTVASQTAFCNGPPTAGVHRLCGHLHVCSSWTSTVYKAMALTKVTWLMHVWRKYMMTAIFGAACNCHATTSALLVTGHIQA